MRNVLRKMKPYYVRKALRYLRHYGLRDFTVRVRERLSPDQVPYGPWYEKHQPTAEDLARQRGEAESALGQGSGEGDPSPLFSVLVPIYRTPEAYLRQMIGSVLRQTYPNLELVLANASPDDAVCSGVLASYAKEDARVRVLGLDRNGGISANTNAAIRAARGEYLCFLDHDDLIREDALYQAWKAIRRSAEEEGMEPDLLYTDEDKVRSDGRGGLEHFQPHFKPDFNLDLLRSNHYICHFLMVRKTLAEEVGGLDCAYDGAQDYDFVLRCTDAIRKKYPMETGRGGRTGAGRKYPAKTGVEDPVCQVGRKDMCGSDGQAARQPSCRRRGGQRGICHIPMVLYSWRVHAESTADNPDSKSYAYEAGRRALEASLARSGEEGKAVSLPDYGFYRVRYELTDRPLVSIIIPSHEQADLLSACIESIRSHTGYDNYEVIVVENNSHSREVLDYYKKIQRQDHVRVIRWKGGAFNFSSVCNWGAAHAEGAFLVFLNNDTEVEEGWLTELLSVCLRPGVGAAGPRLLYPDGKIQSAGIVVGIGGVAGSLFTGMNGAFSGYLHKASLVQDLSAVTAACMMVRREAFELAGGFTEELAVAFNDVDLCLKIRDLGQLVVYDPFAQVIHKESVSRGDEYTKEKADRYRREAAYMKETWQAYYEQGDPYYNPNLSLAKWDYTLKDD